MIVMYITVIEIFTCLDNNHVGYCYVNEWYIDNVFIKVNLNLCNLLKILY